MNDSNLGQFTKAELVIKLVLAGFSSESSKTYVQTGNVQDLHHTGRYPHPMYPLNGDFK